LNLIINQTLRSGGQAELSESVFHCAKEIMLQIYSGDIEPSMRLGETSLATQLGQTKAQVRSALDYLAHVGVVERRARSGTYVRRLSLNEFVERAGLRACLEGLAAREACLHLKDNQLSRLKDMALRIDESLRVHTFPYAKLLEMDSQFHMLVTRASNNSLLVSELSNQRFLLRCLGDARLLNLPMVGAQSLDVPNHLNIVESLERRDPQLAEATIRAHIFRSLHACLTSYLQAQISEDPEEKAAIKIIRNQAERVTAWISVSDGQQLQ
jgi:DNA-binding GntR family transcriptional regulator